MINVSEVQQPLSMTKGTQPWKPGVNRSVAPSKDGRTEHVKYCVWIWNSCRFGLFHEEKLGNKAIPGFLKPYQHSGEKQLISLTV